MSKNLLINLPNLLSQNSTIKLKPMQKAGDLLILIIDSRNVAMC